jgi:hypothetical protein
MGEERNQPDCKESPLAALLGRPTGESLRREELDGSRFSTTQPIRPAGVPRAQYLAAEPGTVTDRFMREAGLGRATRRRRRLLLALALVIVAAALWLNWGPFS